MKKWITAILIIFSAFNMKAQEVSYGATVGYNNFIVKASFQGISSSAGESGLYLGLFADFGISDKFHIQPEVQYVAIFANNDSGNELIIPIVAKYYVADKLSIQAGPQFDLILDESPGLKKFGFGLATGLGYDISENLSASVRYSFGLNDRLDGVLDITDGDGFPIDISGISTKFNFFQFGIGYKF